MNRRLLLTIIILLCCEVLVAQQQKLDNLAVVNKNGKQDSTLVELLINKAIHYRGVKPDSVIICINQSLALARKIGYKMGETGSLDIMGLYYFDSGDLAESMKIAFELLSKARAINDNGNIWGSYTLLGLDYYELQDYKKAFAYLLMSKNVAEKHRLHYEAGISYNNLVFCYTGSGKLDSAEYFNKQLFGLNKYIEKSDLLTCTSLVKLLKGDYAAAVNAARESAQKAPGEKNYNVLNSNYLVLAKAYRKLSRPDSSLFFAKKSFEYASNGKRPAEIIGSAGFLRDYYQSMRDYKQAFDYQQIVLSADDSLYNQREALQIQSVTSEQEQRRRTIEDSKEAYQNNVRLYSLLGVLAAVLVVAFILLYNNRQRKKANLLLSEQKEEIAAQRDGLGRALEELKVTQNQLIQSEKMASLGELTAGIAHEIQNPLNFVNNFSEVSAELVDEMSEELNKGDIAEAKAIGADLKQNLEKIRHHGKRADFIVKGMLEHSRTSKGEKTLTNINVLADEFLKLSYHGLRAKDKNFNAEMITHFDEQLPKIEIVQQDIGRVLLNLFNNAFYAVSQKQKTAGADYKPMVELTTFAPPSGGWGVKVRDNGAGIPDAIKDKIMQPFFTTKPTGEGTGLGLSLSYDIVVKGHGGSIDIDSVKDEYSIFIIKLPLTNKS